jgi:hypothetical protein
MILGWFVSQWQVEKRSSNAPTQTLKRSARRTL